MLKATKEKKRIFVRAHGLPALKMPDAMKQMRSAIVQAQRFLLLSLNLHREILEKPQILDLIVTATS